ncbi:P-loop NTPase fold protein [Clavibacter sp. VKM Ac-2542]|uniref:KAP family P-loop NTPase fold protein n=1 Tax=Clavibacter sp. VKM Ac-2542 TaxID=2783811 RepID=UPI00188A967F|nr:P-loop NTPase fold protein [Clavibacter sp. VKM Ac-2542]MBF4621877.1 AAA family ATPase [Clavibacter sp. VKM Ac-2542]
MTMLHGSCACILTYMASEAQGSSGLEDDPIRDRPGSEDRLDRAQFADDTATLLQALGAGQKSSVVGLIGAWGSGKSSLLNMIRKRLEEDSAKSWIIAEFNPWYYSDSDSLQVGFFRELAASLPKKRSWKKLGRKLATFGQATAPVAGLFAGLGVDATNSVRMVSSWLQGDQSLRALGKEVDAELLAADQPVLMVLDDLDRLAPDELLRVFKLLRLTGRLSNVHYLISYDEDTLLDVLTRTGLVGLGERRRAVEYLEKMVQVRLDMPPLQEHQITSWLDAEIDPLALGVGIDSRKETLVRFLGAYHSIMRPRLTTPRSIRRFLAQVKSFPPKSSQDLDLQDYLVITWIRTTEPLLYAELKESKRELLGDPASSVPQIRREQSDGYRRQVWERKFANAHVDPSELGAYADVLSDLFPHFGAAWMQTGTQGSVRQSEAPRIGNSDYFDRYFHFGIPANDISDVLAYEAYRSVSTSTRSESLSEVEASYGEKATLIISKMRAAYLADVSGGLPFLKWLVDRDVETDDTEGTFGAKRQLRGAQTFVFSRLDAKELHQAIQYSSGSYEGLAAASGWLHYANAPEVASGYSEERRQGMSVALTTYDKALRFAFEKLRDVSPLEFPEAVWDRVWDWYSRDQVGLTNWVREQHVSKRWSPLDTVARFVTTSYISDVPHQHGSLGGMDYEAVDKIVGMAYLSTVLEREIAQATDPWPKGSVEASPDTRRVYALQLLRRHLHGHDNES